MNEDGREDSENSGFAARNIGDDPAADSDEDPEGLLGLSLYVCSTALLTSIFPNPMLFWGNDQCASNGRVLRAT